MIDTDVPGSDGWWLQTLATQLHDRRVGRSGIRRFSRNGVAAVRIRPGLELLGDYLAGDIPLREDIHSTWAAEFRQYLRMGRLNIAPLLVSSPANRMGIRDFRTSAADDELGDEQARILMRRNNLRLKARQVHDWMLGLGDGYTIVTPPDGPSVENRRGWSLITAESPLECITAHDPATGATLAGLKMFRDDLFERDLAYLFLPGRLQVAVLSGRTSSLFKKTRFTLTRNWAWDDEKSDDVPGGRVAMVRFQSKDGRSEIEGHLDHLDRINDKLFNDWWLGKLQAHRQRAVELPDQDEDDDTPDEDDEQTPGEDDLAGIFTSAPDALWQLPKGAKMWESQAADLRQLPESVKSELQWLAAGASVPLHTITPDAANGSAEGASLMREEHVYKVEDRRDRADGSWAETMAMAFEFQGDDERADVAGIEAIWGPVERYSLAEKASAAAAVNGIVPREAIWTDVLQYAPADVVGRLRTLRGQDLMFAPEAAATPATGALSDRAAALSQAATRANQGNGSNSGDEPTS